MDSGASAPSPDESGDKRSRPQELVSNSLAHPGDREPLEVFICSEAGKPIYCYNKNRDEEFVVTLMPLLTSMINFFRDAQREDSKSQQMPSTCSTS